MRSKWLPGLSSQRFVIDEVPNVISEAAKLTLHCKERFCVADCGIDFETIANDPFVVQQRRDLSLIVFGDLLWIEAIESGAVVVALAKNGFPTESRLSSFENQKLKQTRIVMNRHAPLC